MVIRGWLKRIITYRSYLFLFLYPVLLSPLVTIHDTPQAKGAYALLLMAGYCITEVIPIYVTAHLPMVMPP